MNNIFENAKNKNIIDQIPTGYDVDLNRMTRLWPKYIKYYYINKKRIDINIDTIEETIILFSQSQYRKKITYVYCENTSSIYEYYLKDFLLHNIKGWSHKRYYKSLKESMNMYYLDGTFHQYESLKSTDGIIWNSTTENTPIWSNDKRVIRYNRKNKLERIKNQ